MLFNCFPYGLPLTRSSQAIVYENSLPFQFHWPNSTNGKILVAHFASSSTPESDGAKARRRSPKPAPGSCLQKFRKTFPISQLLCSHVASLLSILAIVIVDSVLPAWYRCCQTFRWANDAAADPSEYWGFCACLLYTSPSPRDQRGSRMPSSA